MPPTKLRADRGVALRAAAACFDNSVTCEAFECLSSELRNDRDVLMAFIANAPQALKHASASINESFEFLLAAVDRRCTAYNYISGTLKDNPDIILKTTQAFVRTLETRQRDRSWKLPRCVVFKFVGTWDYTPYAGQVGTVQISPLYYHSTDLGLLITHPAFDSPKLVKILDFLQGQGMAHLFGTLVN